MQESGRSSRWAYSKADWPNYGLKDSIPSHDNLNLCDLGIAAVPQKEVLSCEVRYPTPNMPSLPRNVLVGIRDHWSEEDSPLQKSLTDLNGVLGYRAIVHPEWQLLLVELDSFYADKDNFIPVVAGCVQAWVKSITELLDDPAHEDWPEALLERTCAAGSRLRIFLEVASDDKASTFWSNWRQGFVIHLPKAQVTKPAELFPIFRGDLLKSFESEDKQPGIPPRPRAAVIDATDDLDVEMDTSMRRATVVDIAEGPAAALPALAKVEFLRSVASLPGPHELLLRPPYHLVVHGSDAEIEIHGSHSPSLELLAGYLKRWCRANHHDSRSPPGVEVRLHQSAFGLGETFDRVVLSTRSTCYMDEFQVTAPMLLSLIEGALGYECVSARPSTWSFRRDAVFITL